MLGFAEEDFCLCSQWKKKNKHYDWGIGEGNMCFIFGEFLVQIQEYGYLQMVVTIVSENSTSPGTLINLDQFRVVSRARNPIQPMKNHENCALNILNEINV